MRIAVLARLNLLRYPIVSRFTSIRYPDLLPGTAVPNACRGHANVRPVSPKRPFVPSEWLSVFRSGLMVNCLLQRTGCAGSYPNKNNSSLKSKPMKKLFVMTMVLLVAAGCSRDEAVSPDGPDNGGADIAPHFYGMAMLDDPSPETRGVAVNLKSGAGQRPKEA